MSSYTSEKPKVRLLRIRQVLEIIPISKTTWWQGIKDGRFPLPVKLGPRTTCWRESDVLELIDNASAKEGRHV